MAELVSWKHQITKKTFGQPCFDYTDCWVPILYCCSLDAIFCLACQIQILE
jgi:hypothetical protein